MRVLHSMPPRTGYLASESQYLLHYDRMAIATPTLATLNNNQLDASTMLPTSFTVYITRWRIS
jgi:hypothetical protein